ncbi:hypothetical protein CC78DRAFT_608635 [Lojkania enalia]|uniref:Lysine-specific metallo-endopeptidase domain-containing protein n=1 Tax=Lojkania enalia TaxID=147567 RepID=A0A9P4MXE8_9PLEO|nr:hypothetical protein CC78DRAFT_608635 [Didymosphaeria enalia]
MGFRNIFFISTFIASISATNKLVGFEGCNTNQGDQKDKINEAFQQAKKVFDVVRAANIDWNSAAAVEFLGPPGFNQNMQSVIQGIIWDVAKVNGGSIHDDFSINVRCDDLSKFCGTNNFAYTTQRGPDGSGYNTGSITFCKRFFDSPSLDEAVEAGKREFNWQKKYNMNTYDEARAVTFIHELLHIDWVASAERYGPNLHVKDWEIEFYDHENHDKKEKVAVYGARMAKTLARWNDRTKSPQPGRFIARSAENLALYTLAIYMTGQLGAYPHLPIVNTKPNKEPNFNNENAFEIDSNGNIFANSTFPQDIEILSTSEDSAETALIESFLDDSEYPQSYLDEWHHWANPLTQSSNFHNQFHDGWITTATMQQSTWSSHDVETKADGSYTAVWDGWVNYWTSACPNAVGAFMWPASYGDVYLKSDGYLHDGSDNIIGTIKIDC